MREGGGLWGRGREEEEGGEGAGYWVRKGGMGRLLGGRKGVLEEGDL